MVCTSGVPVEQPGLNGSKVEEKVKLLKENLQEK